MKTQATQFARLHIIYPLLWIGLLLIPSAGQCFYNPNSGKWLSRDFIGEKGGLNEYGILNNQVVGRVDLLGRKLLIAPSADPEFKQRTLRCLCTLAWSARGYELIKAVERLPETWVITPMASADAPSTGNERVFMDPRGINGVGPNNAVRVKYPSEMPPENLVGCAIILGHEFGHVLDEEDEYYAPEEVGPPLAGTRRPPPDNNNVAKNENPVRRSFGVPARRTYHGAGPIPAPD